MKTRLILVAAIAASALGVLAQGDVQSRAFDLLKRVVESGGTVDYSGKRVVEFKVGADMRAHTEQVLRVGAKTRIDFPPGSNLAGQVIVEGPDRREHYYPDLNEIRVMPARRQDALDRLRFFVDERSRFKFDVASGGKVAGRSAQLVTVADRQGNKLQELWLDDQKPMVLKRAMYDPVGTRVGQYEFVSIDFNPRVPHDAFRIRRRGAKYVTMEEHAQRIAKEGGFAAALLRDPIAKLESAETRNFMGKEVFVQLYEYDGRRLTLFQVDKDLDSSRLGRMGRRVEVHSWTSGGRSFALVGELAKSKLEDLAKKVSERSPES